MPTKFFDTVPITEIRVLSSADLETQRESEGEGGRQAIRNNRRSTILVVDDERVIADTLVAILNESGFSACSAYSGDSALRSMAAQVPDLVITDVSMPGMNGIDLAITIRQQFPGCRVLLFSGHAATSGLMEEAQARGYSFELLTKPVHPRDLLDRLQHTA